MRNYVIKIDRKYVSGLSDECYTTEEVTFYLTNKGFHCSNKCGIQKLALSTKAGNAVIVCGIRNLHSWIDKLHTRVDSGLLTFKKMVIEDIGDGSDWSKIKYKR